MVVVYYYDYDAVRGCYMIRFDSNEILTTNAEDI